MLGTFITILAVVLGILLSIGLHELGHFIPAKKFGVPAPEYFIGFGKRIWSIKRGETEYGIKMIPAGGYTKIEGMFPPKPKNHTDHFFKKIIAETRAESLEGMKDYDEKRAFYNLTFGKKLLVMMGGTLTNLVLAFICFALAFGVIGSQHPTTSVAQVLESSPSLVAGLLPGDVITEVDGKKVSAWDDIITNISNTSPDQAVDIKILRGTQLMDFSVAGIMDNGTYRVGITPTMEFTHQNPIQTGETTLKTTWATMQAIVGIPAGMVDALRSIFTNTPRENKSLVSVVGVGQIAVKATDATDNPWLKLSNILSILGSLNIALFVFNLIPLLPLDGGHSANAIYEGIKRGIFRLRKKPRPGPADLARTMPIAYVVITFLFAMFAIIVLADILHPIV